MLCSQNSGKYLWREWHENVERAVDNTDNFNAADLSFLEMDGTLLGPIGRLDRFRSTMRMKTVPVDPESSARDYVYNVENPAVGD